MCVCVCACVCVCVHHTFTPPSQLPYVGVVSITSYGVDVCGVWMFLLVRVHLSIVFRFGESETLG